MGEIRVLFCGVSFPASFEYTKECLQQYPHIQVDAWPFEKVPSVIHDYDICVVRMMRLDATVISKAKKLKLIVQFGVGLEGVDIPAATQAGIRVARIASDGTGNALSCAEHAIYLILSLLRDQKQMEKAVLERRLGEPIGQTLYGKTVLIVGYGNIGKELAMRLRPFGVQILATKRSWNPTDLEQKDDYVDKKGGRDSLYQFAKEADIIVTCCLLTPETAGMINEAFLSVMKLGALLVNVARGGVLDYAAVKAALDRGELGGLGIDVAWNEPLDPTDPILQHPKVVITPHVAGVTELAYRTMAKIIANTALELHSGVPFSDLELVN